LVENMFAHEYDQNNDEILVSALGILGNISEIDETMSTTPIESRPCTLAKREIWKLDPLALSLKILQTISTNLFNPANQPASAPQSPLKKSRLQLLDRLTWFLLNITNTRGLPPNTYHYKLNKNIL